MRLPQWTRKTARSDGWRIVCVAKAFAPDDTGVYAEAKFSVRVIDETAPKIAVNKEIHVVQGEELTAEKVLLYALDDHDGDLLRSATVGWIWNRITTDYDPATSQIGEELDGQIRVYDSNGNEAKATFTVVVCGTEALEPADYSEELEGLDAKLDGLQEKVEDTSKLDALTAKVAELEGKLATLQSSLDEVAKDAEQSVTNTTKGCKKAGMIVAGLVAAAGLVLVVLRKKH